MSHFNPGMDRVKALVLLNRARLLIESDEETLICFAIHKAECLTKGNGQSHYLITWVQDMLGVSATYSWWVRLHHPELFSQLSVKQQAKKAKEGRLAWIDWMIQEVQS